MRQSKADPNSATTKAKQTKLRSPELGHRQSEEDQSKDAPRPAAAEAARKQKRRPHTIPTRMRQHVATWCRGLPCIEERGRLLKLQSPQLSNGRRCKGRSGSRKG